MMLNEKVMNTKVSYLTKIKNFDIGHFLVQQSYDKWKLINAIVWKNFL
jgi:hypothetical protein